MKPGFLFNPSVERIVADFCDGEFCDPVLDVLECLLLLRRQRGIAGSHVERWPVGFGPEIPELVQDLCPFFVSVDLELLTLLDEELTLLFEKV